uniref:Uncharacterized protein n=1 Tax=Arundo donax TaxID=35708 RepID=A0A0A8ZUV8_ARUDO
MLLIHGNLTERPLTNQIKRRSLL